MERMNPRFHMGKQMERIPVSIWGSPYRNGSPFPNGDRSVTNPFPNRVHAHLGIEVKITIWECFPYGDHRFHLVITVQKWAGRLKYSHMGNPRFRIEFVSIWGSTYMLIPKWLQTPYGYGESPNAKYFVSLPLSIRGLPIWLRGLCFWPSI
jgi:hypothetical protein